MNSEIPLGTRVFTSGCAYQEIQDYVSTYFFRHIGKSKEQIKCIVIVGAYWGIEIAYFLQEYPNALIYAFEANPVHFASLKQNYQNESRVKLYNDCIASENDKEVTFSELSMPGCGSIMEYQGDKFGSETVVAYKRTFRARTLSSYEVLQKNPIDLLWVDVQGAELEVLKGVDLQYVESMFLEVKTREYVKESDKEPYKGQCFLEDLLDYTKDSHKLISIGLDNDNHNGQGNSFWVHKRNMKKLSLLICSLHGRAKYLSRLRDCLEPQIKGKPVEVLVCLDNGERTIGEKRNTLLEQATGEYIAFIDDDDLVSSCYVDNILNALTTSPDVVGMRLLMYTDGQNPQVSTHSLQHKTWYDEPDPEKPGNKRYYRNPNHLNPVKREYALRTKFPSISMCEDRNYSERILPLLKTEVMLETPIYLYLVRTAKEC